jgi:hypothetical protein
VWNGVVVDGCVRATSIRALAPVAALGLLESLAPDHILPADHAGSRLPPTVDPDVAAKSPLRLVPFETIAGEDQVTLEVSGREWAGLTRRGRVLSVSFPLLGQLVHSRASRDARASHTVDALLEDALFLLIEDQLAYYQRAALRVCDRRSDSAAASATLPERPVLRRRGIIETEPAEELDRPAALELRKLADERQGCVFELFSQQRIDDLELWFAWPVALVQGADTDGGKLEVTRVQAPSEGVRIRLGLPPNQPRRLRILRSRSGRYEELAAMVDASGDRAPTEYMPDELLPRVSGLIEVVNRFTPFSSLAGTSVAHMYCGYGPFPLAVHLVERPRRLIGIDRQAESVEVAAWLAEELGAHGIVFRLAQLDQLGPLNDSVDLMLAVDLDLHHVPGSRPQQAVARSFFDALRPGGAIVAEFRSFAPIELRKAFRRAGFGPVRVIDCDLLAPIGRPRGYRKPRFYLAAVKLVA